MLSKLFEDTGELLIMGQEISMVHWKVIGRISADLCKGKGFYYGSNSTEKCLLLFSHSVMSDCL